MITDPFLYERQLKSIINILLAKLKNCHKTLYLQNPSENENTKLNNFTNYHIYSDQYSWPQYLSISRDLIVNQND